MSLLPAVEIEPVVPATATVIWLHGLGADGNDFAPIVPELGLSDETGIRFIFPHAPSIPVTINNGYVMPAWYDILEASIERKVDVQQLEVSAAAVHAFIDREIERGISSDRIVIAGFSQGGAVAYQAALTYPKPLAGLLAMSTYFATADSINVHGANRALPIQIFHGVADDVVPQMLGQQAKLRLETMGYAPGYHTYAMDHSVNLKEIQDVAGYLHAWLGEQD